LHRKQSIPRPESGGLASPALATSDYTLSGRRRQVFSGNGTISGPARHQFFPFHRLTLRAMLAEADAPETGSEPEMLRL
jgi:hypothetical protein